MLRNPLYQVVVENRRGDPVPFGPKMVRQACEQLASTIRGEIAKGNEKDISNPHVVAVI
jgi:hypothetical protein